VIEEGGEAQRTLSLQSDRLALAEN
jgi:hypothetical protein